MRYDIELATFREAHPLELTRSERAKISPRDRRIEHLALTSRHTLVRDALTFVFERTLGAVRRRKQVKGKEKANEACDDGESEEGECFIPRSSS
jgi:hypothetical protein